jgi:xanthine dehydrogenase large subunit
VGWLTHEELYWDDKGRLLTDGPATYKIPAIGDMPAEFNVALLGNSTNNEATVFHSKAVGEPPLMLAISAFAAIRDAIASLAGHELFPQLNAPATPEEVLRVCSLMRNTDQTRAATGLADVARNNKRQADSNSANPGAVK